MLIAVLWNVYDQCENIANLKGHSNVVMDLHFTTDGRLDYINQDYLKNLFHVIIFHTLKYYIILFMLFIYFSVKL